MKVSIPTITPLLITLPRAAITYPVYLLSVVLVLDHRATNSTMYIRLFLLTSLLVGGFTIQYVINELSITAFMLEFALLAPLLLFVSGFKPALTQQESLQAIRCVNLVCCVASILSLVDEGFPYDLPYLDFLPDAYFGTYGIGGARIVTVFGFVGLLFEVSATSRGRYWPLWSLLAMVNFITPSYIIGIACGAAAFTMMSIRRPRLLLFLFIAAAPAAVYALARLNDLDSTAYRLFGVHPKIYAYLLVLDLLSDGPLNFLLGTGLGQFTSTPQIWASDAFNLINKQGVPHVPGLFSSSFHIEKIDPVSSIVYLNPYALSSAANKPYTGLSTLVSETGITSVVLFCLFFTRAMAICRKNRLALIFFSFYLFINLVDQWSDNIWLGYCLMVVTAFFGPVDTTVDDSHIGSVTTANCTPSPKT